MRVLQKRAEAEKAWNEKAQLIKYGKAPHPWDILKERGYVKDIAGYVASSPGLFLSETELVDSTDQQIAELMRTKRIGAYVGIDPTAPSLHVGHLVPLMALYWMYVHGYRAHTVIGGATAKIGDPTDRLQSREPMTRATIATNITKTHYQLKRLWANVDNQARRFGYEKEWSWERGLFNNSMWYHNTPFIEVVQRLFKGLRLGPLLSRDTVKRRMTEGDGMSLDEFVYPLLQAWDWWHMFSSPKQIHMQIGGSDQYGNIISGIEAIKYMRNHEPNPNRRKSDDLFNTPVGFTVPLLTDSSGAKFGKSAGNAVWLDQFMTSTFDLYAYFMRRPDADVENLLKLFTFLPLERIKEIMEEQNRDPSKRPAQHALAFEVVALVHGVAEATATQAQHRGLYSRREDTPQELRVVPNELHAKDVNMASAFRVDIQLPESCVMHKSIASILYAAGLAPSKTEANRLTKQQGAYIGGAPGQPSASNKGMSYGDLTFTPVKNWFPEDTKNFLIDGKLLILRRGKHFIRVVEMVSDEEWEASGKTYPGEPYKGEMRQLRQALKDAAGGRDLGFKTSELQAILSEQSTIDFHKRLEEDKAEEKPQLTFLERRRLGRKTNTRHKTPVDRYLANKPAKEAAARKLLQARRRGEIPEISGE
ncbi:hypothetical protein DL765_000578 [Monosporascus sp. GIB2]|nr:hypothetical protein DL765_000578 [Monosporascus sp. GIB2]